MGCNCGKKKGSVTYTHTSPTGVTKTYNTEVEAKAAKIRAGGGEVKAVSR